MRDWSKWLPVDYKFRLFLYGKVGLRGHKMTQITENNPLDDRDSEYDVRSCPKKRL
jgi:hypothetical protein